MPASSPFQEILVPSSVDQSLEPSLLFLPEEPRALVVGLHTWSTDRTNQAKAMLPPCQHRQWALLLPEFRGPNLASNLRAVEAGGSRVARQDILDAARWVLDHHFPRRPPVFLLGGSGGGHMALLTAARGDFAWDAVSSWCPITDLRAWHGQNAHYAPHIEAVCGGPPGASASVDDEYRERSPLAFAEGLRGLRLQIAHGRHDRSVPCSQSWMIARELQDEARFTFWIFDGGHDLLMDAAFAFFDGFHAADPAARLTS